MTSSYCVRKRKQTLCIPGSERLITTKNGRPMLQCACASCGATKSRFMKGGSVDALSGEIRTLGGHGLDIHKQLLKIAPKKGLTLPEHRYTGPGNPLEKQVRWAPDGRILEVFEQPAGKTDAVAMQHDVDYSVCDRAPNKLACKHEADRKIVAALEAIPWKERQWGHALARNAIQSKQKFGLVVKKK